MLLVQIYLQELHVYGIKRVHKTLLNKELTLICSFSVIFWIPFSLGHEWEFSKPGP